MKVKMHVIYQGLLLVLHAINVYGGVVPAKYQAIVAAALAFTQAALGLYNHYYAPDGTKLPTT